MKRILITGGAGFIGSAVVRHIINFTHDQVLVLDKLSYAGNLASLAAVCDDPRFTFSKVDICERSILDKAIAEFRPQLIMHLAAESHVDRSIEESLVFVETNIIGTYTILESSRQYWKTLSQKEKSSFLFLHVSTDEVFGDLENENDFFTETTPYIPNNPYSATKASSDHLVRAWYRTYGLPVIVTNCSNNYGPYHFPEKLIPRMITNALGGRPLPIYGDGMQIRDWLYVEDHVRALYEVITRGKPGETYNIGGHNEWRNIEAVHMLCDFLQDLAPQKPVGVHHYRDLITCVADRLGHDRRYAIDAGKIERELGWCPQETFESGLRKTIVWFIDNPEWWKNMLDRSDCGKRRLDSNVMIT